MIKKIEVNCSDGRVCRVLIGENAIEKLDDLLPDRRIIVITDSNVHRIYPKLIGRFEHIIIGLGETNKTLQMVSTIYNQFIEKEVDRESFILAIGGGIVTDIAGFVASTYMRGVSFGFVATTLLAQVDASVGGKNGVNVEGYKNMVGTFTQPDFVVCDTKMIGTLSEREALSGFAEVIKAGLIADVKLFRMFEKHTTKQILKDQKLLSKAIIGAIQVKATIVERDEKEAGERRKLNLGHTFAHAIEKNSSAFSHGEAVAIGMVEAAKLAVKMGRLKIEDAKLIESVIKSNGLPVESDIDMRRLLKALMQDKKRDSDSIYMVLPTSIGVCVVEKVEISRLASYYSEKQSVL